METKLTPDGNNKLLERLGQLLQLALGRGGLALELLEILTIAFCGLGEGRVRLLLLLAQPHAGVLHRGERLGVPALLCG